VQRYANAADRKRMAREAMAKLIETQTPSARACMPSSSEHCVQRRDAKHPGICQMISIAGSG
jgi:hypothetical protein